MHISITGANSLDFEAQHGQLTEAIALLEKHFPTIQWEGEVEENSPWDE